MPELKSINLSDITEDMELLDEETIRKLAYIFASDALEKLQAKQSNA